MIFTHRKIKSPVGILHAVSNGNALAALVFDNGWKSFIESEGWSFSDGSDEITGETEKQLAEYFSGNRTEFDIPLYLSGTEFQNQAWKALLKIPFGKTFSYSEQAEKLKNPAAVRAVGAANGKNKICIIVPCHRVIGKNGSLTGFGGGLDIKKQLLDWKARKNPSFNFHSSQLCERFLNMN